MFIDIVESKISVEDLIERVRNPKAGAIVTFEGTVREESDGIRVDALYYESYREMAIREIESMVNYCVERFNITDAAVVHRIGTVQITEDSVVIAVSAPHRDQAFSACRYIIDQIKERAPIWKRDIIHGAPADWH
ncbi:molybdopterin synthase [Thermoplasma sp. Kam2015]|uniref:molybdopterin synthase catalytic subunit n=1 Tax=Thermoplasma sp. Kam2015 TaxID=2094122 RepID=UPI000D907FCF|nr:molybdenum cofactor biosynthesis protein MoaE [Thermoplasma sp. Kam2015]PYB67497.1 molybdopterin synthase [Thermoplasma sp. Kam2015]